MELSNNEKTKLYEELEKTFKKENRIIIILHSDGIKTYEGFKHYQIEDERVKNSFVDNLMKTAIKLAKR